MSVIADIDHNRSALAVVEQAARAYLAAYTPSDDPAVDDAYADLAAALEDLLAADPRDGDACHTCVETVGDRMRAVDVALGLAPGGPSRPVRMWRTVRARLSTLIGGPQ